MQKIKIAIMGFGGMAASHKAAYDRLARDGAPIELVAVCDKNPKCLESVGTTNLGTVEVGSFDGITLYTDPDEMLVREELDAVDICLPTFLHKDFTLKFLRAGKHVLCEKPMALSGDDCIEMVKTAHECGKELMIGQCLRFDPAYLYLKELVDLQTYGKARRVIMGRYSYMPAWGGWFSDPNKSGGCVVDFHIHDIDMLRFLFGDPDAVSSIAHDKSTGWQYVNSRFYYDGMIAEATASFDESPTTPFSMGYRVRFDKATVILDACKVTVYPDEGEPYAPKLPSRDRIADEIGYFASVIIGKSENTVNPPESAASSIMLAQSAAKSSENGGKIIRFERKDYRYE